MTAPWVTKFVATIACRVCGRTFNAVRYTERVCPDCTGVHDDDCELVLGGLPRRCSCAR